MKSTILERISPVTRTIRESLALVIPVLFIGSITVLVNGFPIQAYQDFLDSFLSGALRNIIQIIQVSTVGILAVYIDLALGFSYLKGKKEGPNLVTVFGTLMGCLAGFFILVGFFSGEPDFSLLSGQGVFSAMIAGLTAPVLFRKFEEAFKIRKLVFVEGADSVFNASLRIILPVLCVVAVFAAFNYIIVYCFQVQSLQHLFTKAVNAIFYRMQRSYFSGLLFTGLASGMWWFGIHGNNVLNQVAEDTFMAIIPGQIVSKSFIDTFVFMGGTGCAIGLLIAIMIFGKRSSTKKLSHMALLPGIFNISELCVFGFPVIYNPYMIVPFILSPLLCFTSAYLATIAGFMPEVIRSVVWTTPPLLSGYLATGSVMGIVIQLVNILISVVCYAPFVIKYEKKSLNEFTYIYDELVALQKKNQESPKEVRLTECEGNIGRLAKYLAIDLDEALLFAPSELAKKNIDNPLLVEYQLMYKGEKCTGARALLKWDHDRYGSIYFPLAMQLARESGILFELETFCIKEAVSSSASYRQQYGDEFKIIINVTSSTLLDERIIPLLQELADQNKLRSGNIRLEVSDECEAAYREDLEEVKRRIRVYGYD